MSRYPLVGADAVTPGEPINWARNGIAPSAPDVRELAGWLNGLAGRRKKRVFAKSVLPVDSYYDQADVTLWRGAFHSGPFTSRLRCDYLLAPTRGASGADTGLYVVSNTGLAGSGTTVTHPKLNFWNGDFTGTIRPDQLVPVSQDLTVSPDTDYTLALHVDNGMRVCGAVIYEEWLSSLTEAITGAVNGSGMVYGLDVLSADVAALLALAEKIWKRGGKHFGTWTERAGVARTTDSYANLWNLAAAWSDKTPGHKAPTRYMGSLDSAAVACTWACYAKVASGSGKVGVYNEDGLISKVAVTSTTGAWYSDTFALDSATAEEKLDVHIYGAGDGGALTIYAVGAWCHVA